MNLSLRVGDVAESAAWFETPEQRAKAEALIRHVLDGEGTITFGEIRWSELEPGDERVPPPPPKAERGVRLLVGEATVLALHEPVTGGGFIGELEPDDLARLRRITRRASGQTLTDQQCDQIIEHFGPEAAVRTLRAN